MTQAFRAIEAKPKGRGDHLAFMEPTPRRVRAMLDGVAIVDSENVLIMHETGHAPAYYFPFADVRMDLMTATDNGST
jgi:uncharacterized protein (DUF427 family)